MTRAEQPTAPDPAPDDALVADSRERAVRALLRRPRLRRLWSAQLVGGVGDILAVLVLALLAAQSVMVAGALGGGYRGAAFAVAMVFAVRVLATLLSGAVLLGPLTALTAPDGPLDRRWTMAGADGARVALFLVAPLWIDWTAAKALVFLLVTAFLSGIAERLWSVCRESAAPALLPAPPPEGASVRPSPDHLATLRLLTLRTTFAAVPTAAAALVLAGLLNNLLGVGVAWFATHQAALGSYLAAGLFAASLAVLSSSDLPRVRTPRPRSPLEGLRRPRASNGERGWEKGRTGILLPLVLTCAAVAGAVAATVAVAVPHAADLGGGPVLYGLMVGALTGAVVVGLRTAPAVLPALSRRRLLALAVAVAGVGLLAAGLVPDDTTVLLVLALTGLGAGVAAHTGHALLDQEVEERRRARVTGHLHAAVRVAVALGAVIAPAVAGLIGPHRLESGGFVFAHGGAAFTLMLIGALLLPVAALVLTKIDDRSGVPLRDDLRDAVRRGDDPRQATATSGFFIALEGGDGAGKSTQAEALADWIRGKGHEVVLTREPGATPVGKRLRAILLDVSSAGLSHRAEALLYAADRAEHVDTVVRPALDRGAVVITDRYIDSSVAYQGAGRDLSPTEIARISRWATNGLVPNLTVLLDVSPETARDRFTEAPDRLESEPAEFHARVRSGFLTLAAADPERYLVVDAGQEPEAVTTAVRHRLDRVLPLSRAEIEARERARREAEEEARRKAEEEAARKAEAERLERERLEELARVRAEEEERRRREEDEARRREAERQAEEARQRAEEARRRAETERARLLAEERARAEEKARREAEEEVRRKRAEEEERRRVEEEERRREARLRAERALLRAEEARRAAELAAEAAAAGPRPAAPPAAMEPRAVPEDPSGAAPRRSDERPGSDPSRARTGPGGKPDEGSGPDTPTGTDTPTDDDGMTGTEVTAELPKPPAPTGAFEDTAVLPPVPADAGAEETAVLPPVRGDDPADRVPPGYFRDAGSSVPGGGGRAEPDADSAGRARPSGVGADPTRELPRIDESGATDSEAVEGPVSRPRRRPDWAEETPLDDLPSLADELLGPHQVDEDGAADTDTDADRSGSGKRRPPGRDR
ncbi:dTMP kinase [Streptomyces sp. ZYX-F-203]